MKPFSKKAASLPQAVPPQEDPGSQEISIYSPEYEFLVRLVKLLGKQIPEAIPQIKQLAESYPFKTVADIEYLTTQIWTLATEKYNLPREWLISKLPEKKIKADLWPSQEASEVTLTQSPGAIAYNNPKDTSVSGPNPQDIVDDDKLWSIVVDKFFTGHERWSEVIKAIKSVYPNVTNSVILSLKDRVKKSLDNQMGATSSQKQAKRKSLNLEKAIKILDTKEPKVVHIDMHEHRVELADGTSLTFEEAVSRAMEMDKEGVFSGAEFSNTEFNVNPTLDNGPYSSPQDQGKGHQKSPFPNTNWEPANDDEGDAQPYSNIASSKKFSKKEIIANPNKRYWIDPQGTQYPVEGTSHSIWMLQNRDILKKYGIDIMDKYDLDSAYQEMMDQGWVRISNEPMGQGFQIQVESFPQVPLFLDDFIAHNFIGGDDEILIGNGKDQGIYIKDPFPSIQKAVNKALRQPVTSSLKQADISGKVVNEILNLIHSFGGVTYNLQNGNLAQSNMYAVSIFPARELVLEGIAEHDDIQHYLDINKDLLNDPNNSFGVWTSNGKTYLDVVVTTPNKEQALELARENNQLAIWDLKNMAEIPTGIVRAFNKKDIVKEAEESPLTEEQANQIAAASCPAYVIALNNFYSANSRGHDKDRSLAYAIDSVKNIEKIDEKKLVEFINTYLGPVK